MKLEKWKAACKVNGSDELEIIDLLAFGHMDVFNRIFSMKGKQLLFTAREHHFKKTYANFLTRKNA